VLFAQVMKTLPFCAIAFAVLVTAGCSSAIEGDIAEPAVRRGDSLVITAAGVAGVTAATDFSEAAVEAALPGYDAAPVTMATEDRTLDGFAVFRDGLQVLQVVPGTDGKVGAVHGVSAQLRGPGNTRIGMSLAESRIPRSSCREGTGNWSGMPICTAPGAPNVALVFAIPSYVDPDAPPDESALATATLQRFIWTPEDETS
jgi:hypothetical protein